MYNYQLHNYRYHHLLLFLLFLIGKWVSFGQCNIIIDQDFNHWNNRKYTVADAKSDFNNKIKPWTASTYRGISAPGADANLIGNVAQESWIINGELRAQYMKDDAGGYAGGFLFDPYFDGVEEAYLEYKVKFDANFFWATGGKLPGLGGSTRGINSETEGRGAIPSGGRYDESGTGFSARLMWRRNRAQTDTPYLILYSYFAEKPDGTARKDGEAGDAIRIFTGLKDNKWYTVRQYIKLNTPGQDNGTVVMWIDGVEVYRNTKHNIRQAGKGDLKINALIMNTYRGGSRTDPVWHSPRTEYAFFDDFKVWTGCGNPGSGTVTNTPPSVSFDASVATTIEEGYNAFYVLGNASDADGSIAKVELFIDGVLVRQETNAPYEWGHATSPKPSETLGLTVGEHELELVATDDKGATSTATKTITITEKGVSYLYPIHDAYLQTSTAFNTEDLRVEAGNRVSYLKFNVAGITPSSLEYIQLELTVGTDAGQGTVSVYKGIGNVWTETNLTTANASTKGTKASEINSVYAIGKTFVFNIPTSLLDASSSFNLIVEMAAGGNDVSFASKENNDYQAPRLKLKLTDDPILGVFEDKKSGLQIYPNPSSSGLFQLSEPAEWHVYSIQGLSLKNGNGTQIAMNDFAKGIYLLNVKGETVRLIIE